MADMGNACVLSSKICNQVFEMFLICLSHGTLHAKSCQMNQEKNRVSVNARKRNLKEYIESTIRGTV